MWKDDSVAWYLEVLMDNSTPTQKRKCSVAFSLWRPWRSWKNPFLHFCHLIPVSPYNLCLFLQYLLCFKLPELFPHPTLVNQCSWLSMPSRQSFKVIGWHLNLVGYVLAVALNSLQDMYLCLPSRPIIALLFKLCLMLALHSLNCAWGLQLALRGLVILIVLSCPGVPPLVLTFISRLPTAC